MERIFVKEFLSKIVRTQDEEYMRNMITFNISPTLKGLKPSTLITLSNNNKSLYESWIKHGKDYIDSIGISSFELLHRQETVIILFYNREVLNNHLNIRENQSFLKTLGYEATMTLEEKLYLLKERYAKYNCPHEIGIFLGIPLEDVFGFLKCQGKDCLLCGYWKVYGDKEGALRTFENYNKCKVEFAKLYLEGFDFVSSVKYISDNSKYKA